MWQQRQSMSFLCSFQDRADLRPLWPCPMRPHPHRSRSNCCSIFLSFHSKWALNCLYQHDLNLVESGTFEGSGTLPDYLDRADKKIEGPLQQNREIVAAWVVRVWTHKAWPGDKRHESARSWNQHQKLTNCRCCHIYCTPLGTLWTKLLSCPAKSLIGSPGTLQSPDEAEGQICWAGLKYLRANLLAGPEILKGQI